MGKARVLLIENNPTLGIIFSNGLPKCEVLVIGCHENLPINEKKIAEFNPDFLVTDHGLDGEGHRINGIKILETVKKINPKIHCFIRALPLEKAAREEFINRGVLEKGRFFSKHTKEAEFEKLFSRLCPS